MTKTPISTIIHNRYRIDAELRQDALGHIYRAFDLERQVPVTLRLFEAELAADREFEKLARHDAQALVGLKHPNVVPFYALGRTGEQLYSVTEWVDGVNLADHLAQQQAMLPFPEVLAILQPLTTALDHAHHQGLTHRAVQASNVLLAKDGRVLWSEFALGYAAIEPAYLSPEQCAQTDVDYRSDFYSLGVLAYELFTGKRPFDGIPGNIYDQHLNQPVPLPQSRNTAIDAVHDVILLRSLDKAPANRYPSAKAFMDALYGAIGGDVELEKVAKSWPVNAPQVANAATVVAAASTKIATQPVTVPAPVQPKTQPVAPVRPSITAPAHPPPAPVRTAPLAEQPYQVLPLEDEKERRGALPFWLMGIGIVGLLVVGGFWAFSNRSTAVAPAVSGLAEVTATFTADPPTVAPTETEMPASPTPEPTATIATVEPTVETITPTATLIIAQDVAPDTTLETPTQFVPPTQTPTAATPTETNTAPPPTATQFVPPTATPLPTNTAIPTVVPPTATPNCPTVTGTFGAVWGAVGNRVGCQTASELGGFIAEENFQSGKMFWRQPIDDGQAMVAYSNGRWAIYQSPPFYDGEPEYSCTDANTPAISPPTPKRGFGRMWCNIPEIRSGLGNALDAERGYQGVMQSFDNGFMLRSDNGAIYVFYSDGSWEQR